MAGDESTLETSKERVELLKAGITGKKIEELYITCNNFKLANMSESIIGYMFAIESRAFVECQA